MNGLPLLVAVAAIIAAAAVTSAAAVVAGIALTAVACNWLGTVATVAGVMAGLQILLLLELVEVVVVVAEFSVVKTLAGGLLVVKNSASICTSSSSSDTETVFKGARLLCKDCKSIDSILDSAVGVRGEVTRAALFFAQVESMRCLK